MKASFSRVGVLTVFVGLGLLGCEQWRGQAIRRNQGDVPATVPAAGKTNEIDGSVPTSEHSASRRPGALSSEAREIEKHFNIE